MRIVFMGTPEFAVPCLNKLINSEDEVIGVFTQPDKPKGRGYKMQSPPVKEIVAENNIEVYQPKTLKGDETIKILTKLAPDLIVVVAYGKILPKAVLDLPRFGCVNVHASLLPKYRGAAPIQWSIINGENSTGVTTMFMEEGLDTGDMLKKTEIKISANETAGELHDRLSNIGAELLIETIKDLKNGIITRQKQENQKSCYAPMLNQDIAVIDWNMSAQKIHNLIRGLNPWPIAKTTFEGKKLKIYSSKVSNECKGIPGEIISLKPFTISCSENTALIVNELQLEGKKRMKSKDFLNGKKVQLGLKLGL